MAGVWGFFMEPGTGGYYGDAWIRNGRVKGNSFAWNTDPIAFPEQVWRYEPAPFQAGYIAADPRDDDLLWVSAFVTADGSTFHVVIYTYVISTDTWTRLLNETMGGDGAIWVCDMAFDADGATFACIAGGGALGGGDVGTPQGVYLSQDAAEFGYQGAGKDGPYWEGNINKPKSLTAMTIIPAADPTGRRIFVAHNQTGTTQFTRHVVSVSDDDGVTWDDQSNWPGSQFSLECLTVLRYLPGQEHDGWYASDHGGVGAYSIGEQTFTNVYNLTDDTWDGNGGVTDDSGVMMYPFAADPSRAVAFGTRGDTKLYHSTDGGASWNSYERALGHRQSFNYRGARTHPFNFYAAGVTLPTAADASDIWWTPDGGDHWYSAEAEASGVGLSLDFAQSLEPDEGIYEEVLSWRDARLFVGRSRFYVHGDTPAEALDNAQAFAGLLAVLTTAEFTQAVGPWTTAPVAPVAGSNDQYNNIETIAQFAWDTAEGQRIIVELPCPPSGMWYSDQESWSLLSGEVADLAAGALTYRLCTKGGISATQFIGARRIMRGFRGSETIRTLSPDETTIAP